jgi:hypothetical protein
MKFVAEQYDKEELLDAERRNALRKEARRLQSEKLNPSRTIKATITGLRILGILGVALFVVVFLILALIDVKQLTKGQFALLLGVSFIATVLIALNILDKSGSGN